jgi:hypothetical protein
VRKIPTVKVSVKTIMRLKRLGEFGQTYEDVIIEALDEYEKSADFDDEQVELKD